MSSNINILNQIRNATPTQKENLEIKQLAQDTNRLYQLSAGTEAEGDILNRTELENDLIVLEPFQLINKYGEQIKPLLQSYSGAKFLYDQDKYVQKTNAQRVTDAIVNLGQGAVSTVGGLGVLAGSVLNDDLGIAMASGLESLNQGINTLKSDAELRQEKARATVANRLDDVSEKYYQEDIANGKSSLEAGLAKFGRDVINTVFTYDNPDLLLSGTMQATGSLATMGLTSKAISILGKIGQKTLSKAGVQLGEKSLAFADKVRWPVVSGLMEGGGTYTDTVNTVMSMSHEELMANSSEYRKEFYNQIASGKTIDHAKDLAKQEIAIKTGNRAFVPSAVAGTALGTLTRGLENPTAAKTVTEILKNALGETIEESIQGAIGQLGQNTAIKAIANKDQDLLEDVGEQYATGAMFSLGSSGIVQAPSLVKSSAKATSDTVATGVNKAYVKRQDAVEAKDENSVDKVATKVDTLSQEFTSLNDTYQQSDASDEMKTKVNNQIKTINEEVLHISDTEKEFLSSGSKEIVNKATNRLDALQQLVHKIDRTKDKKERILLEDDFVTLYNEITKAELDESLDNEEPVKKMTSLFNELNESIKASPQLNRILQASLQTQENLSNEVTEITEEDLNTPEGRAKINAVVNTAINNISKANLPAIKQILSHMKKVKVSDKFNMTTKKALQAIDDIVSIEQANLQKKINNNEIPADFITNRSKYFKKKQFAVHENVIAGNDAQYRANMMLSAVQHAGDIIKFMQQKDIDSAKEQLSMFEAFVMSQLNKSRLAEDAIQYGSSIGSYSAWNPFKNEFHDVNMTINSQELAQQILAETKVLMDIQEILYKTYPKELGLEKSPEGTDEGGQPIDIQTADTSVDTQTQTKVKDVQEKTETKQEIKTEELKEEIKQVELIENVSLKEQEQLVQDQYARKLFGQSLSEAKVQENLAKKEDWIDIDDMVDATTDVSMIKQKFSKPFGFTESVDELVTKFINKAFKYTNKNWFAYSKNPIKDLYENIQNKNFHFDEELKSRITEEDLEFWNDILNPNDETSEYSQIRGQLEYHLQTELNKKYSKNSNKTRGEVLLNQLNESFDSISKFALNADKLLFNLLKINPKTEELTYSDHFIDLAILGSISWLLNSKNTLHQTRTEDLEEIFSNIQSINQLTNEQRNYVLSSYSEQDLILGIKKYVKNYWSVKTNKAVPEQYAEGIVTQMSTEILEALVELNLVEKQQIKFNIENQDKPKIINRYKVKPMPEIGFTDALDHMVLKQPEGTVWYDNQLPNVPNTYLRSKEPLSDFSKKAIKDRTKVSYFINDLMGGFIFGLGSNIYSLFDLNLDNETNYNKQDYESKKGKHDAIMQALNEFKAMYKSMVSYANTKNKNITDVARHFAYELSAVNRLQMRGFVTPQGNKIMRELLVSTISNTFDMTNKDNQHIYNIALGQAFGIKVHNELYDNIDTKVKNKLEIADIYLKELFTQYYEESLSYKNKGNISLEDRFNSKLFTKDSVQKIKDAFNKADIDLTPVAFHAYLDHIKYEYAKAHNKDLSKYQTALYIEADGVTNGIANLTATATSGEFTKAWVDTMARVGLIIGQSGYDNLADIRNDSNHPEHEKDIYATGSQNFVRDIRKQHQKLNSIEKNQQTDVFKFLNYYLNAFGFDENAWDDKSSWDIHRNVIKNPLTVLTYGAGNARIGANIADTVISGIYEQISKAIQNSKLHPNWTVAECYFPNKDKEIAKKEFKDWFNNLNNLISTLPLKVKGKTEITDLPDQKINVNAIKGNNAIEFVLTPMQIYCLEQNIHQFFGDPLAKSLKNTIGNSVMESTKLFVASTNLISNIYIAALKYAYKHPEIVLSEKELKSDFNILTIEQEELIQKKLAKLAPRIVMTGGLTSAMVIGEKRATNAIGRSFSGSTRGYSETYELAEPGVKAIPYMNIAKDGLMMQILAKEQQSLDVFDGFNMSLANAIKQSQEANKAVADVWQQNPFKDVSVTMDTFIEALVENKNLTNALLQEPNIAEYISNIYYEMYTNNTQIDIKTKFKAILKDYQNTLYDYADSITARHNVLKVSPLMIDQMAAMPKGLKTESLDKYLDISQDTALAAIKLMFKTAITNDKLQSTITFEDAVKAVDLTYQPKQTENKVQFTKIKKKDFKKLFTNLNKQQKTLFNSLFRISSKQTPTVYFGSKKELLKELSNNKDLIKIKEAFDSGSDAIYVSETNTIYSLTEDPTVLLHEYTHVVTSNIITGYYQGVTLPKQAKDAIKRLEVLMDDFLNQEINPIGSTDEQRALINSQIHLMSLLNSINDPAEKLNEFIAYMMGNSDLYKAYQKQKAPIKLQTFFKQIWQQIKTLIFGTAKAAIPKNNDFISHVRFNTLILAKAQPTIFETISNNILSHKDNENTRLVALLNKFNSTVNTAIELTRDPMESIKTTVERVKFNNLNDVIKAGFTLNQIQKDTYQYIVAAYEAGLKYNSDYLNELQRVYDHIIKHLNYEMFMKNPTGSDPNDIKQATDKFNYIKGLSHQYNQISEFMALAEVSDEFRNVLVKLPTIQKRTSKATTAIDRIIENLGFSLLNRLSNTILDRNPNATLNTTIDKLVYNLYSVTKQQEIAKKLTQNKAGQFIDKANDVIINNIDTVSKGIETVGNKLATSDNKVLNTTGKIVGLVGLAGRKNNENAIKEGIVQLMNENFTDKILMNGIFKEVLSDLVGYVKSSKPITDMIKGVKSKIQQFRQMYRDSVPGILLEKFKTQPNKEQLAVLHTVLGKTDINSLASRTFTNITKLLANKTSLNKELDNLLNQISIKVSSNEKNKVKQKMDQLANYMITGKTGGYLMRNANAIADLTIIGIQLDNKLIDEYVSLKAFSLLSEREQNIFNQLIKDEYDAVFSIYSFIGNLKNHDQDVVEADIEGQDTNKYNRYKGYIPSLMKNDISIIVADKKERTNLEFKGYIYLKDYDGYGLTGSKKKAYFIAPFNNRTSFTEGIMQTAALTVDGVNLATGRSINNIAGIINNPYTMGKLLSSDNIKNTKADQTIMPIFNNDGKVIAFERTVDSKVMQQLYKDQDITQALGIWSGRQQEEMLGMESNIQLVDRLFEMWEKNKLTSHKDEYINLYESDDPIIKDALNIISSQTHKYINYKFGSEFMVRKDLVRDVLGERHASIGDMWTGNTRWSEPTQLAVKKASIVIMGPKAFKYLTTAEKWTMGTVSLVRNNIVVRSMIVPALNIVSNIYQLIYRGVPISRLTDVPEKIRELEIYIRNTQQIIQLNVDLGAYNYSSAEQTFIKKRIESLQKDIDELSIAPLLKQGEFSTIADVGASQEDLEFSPGKLGEYMEAQFNKLPPILQTGAKNIFMTKDTALYRAMEKSVQYGDFIAKAILFDHLTKDKGQTEEQALEAIREEFVDYDKLAGRNRQYLEDIGLLWFYNYKLRMAKIAMSIFKNNPLHALIGLSFLPDHSIFGNIGNPLSDNILAKFWDDKLSYSIGPSMITSGAELHPAANFLSAIF